MTKKKNADRQAKQLIDRFQKGYMDGGMTVGEAEDIFDRLYALSDAAMPRIQNLLESSDENERWAALTLLREMGDPQAVPLLHKMLHNPKASEQEKMLAIATLDQLGEPVDEAVVRRVISDPEELMWDAMEQVLETIDQPDHAEAVLELLHQWPPEMQEAYIEEFLGSHATRRLLPLLTALLHSEYDEVILAAIQVVEQLKEPGTVPMLEERGRCDPSPEVRHAAGNAALRLQVRLGEQPARPWTTPPVLPLVHCWLSTIDGSGGQVLFAAWEQPDGELRMLDVMFNDHQGIKDCFSGVTGEYELQQMMLAFAPIDFVSVSLARAKEEVERAYQVTLDAGRRLPLPFLLWRHWLEGEDVREVEEIPLPSLAPSSRDELLDECVELLLLDEFESWFFNPDEVEVFVPRFLKLRRKKQADFGCPDYEALLDESVKTIIDEDYQRLLSDRLRRCAWLLAQLYEEEYVPLWALAAADALEEGVVVEHPLLRGMMGESFINAA